MTTEATKSETPKISFIIPVYRSQRTLEKTIECLLDQDYKFFEIILVIDGGTEKIRKEYRKIVNNPRKRQKSTITHGKKCTDFANVGCSVEKPSKGCHVKSTSWEIESLAQIAQRDLIDITILENKKNMGAPHARNKGAKEAKGDLLWFIDADVYLMPGVARLAAEASVDHPDCDFFYGDYQFATWVKDEQKMLDSKEVIYGHPWDSYMLNSMNYISTMSPVRKEAFIGFDQKLEALQDWDMWIKMGKLGKKGHYLDVLAFKTEVSGQGNISYASPDKFWGRVDKIMENNGVERSDVIFCSGGAKSHALACAKITGKDFHVYPSFKMKHPWKKVVCIGFFVADDRQEEVHAATQGHPAGHLGFFNSDHETTNVAFWIGTDIKKLYDKMPVTTIKGLKEYMDTKNIINVTESQATHDELERVGIDSIIIPIPPERLYDVRPLPKEFSVAIYVNQTQPEIYFLEQMYEIMRSMPDINFRLFGSQSLGPREFKNVEDYGRLDRDGMEKFIEDSACLLRVTQHDGLPLGPVEWVMMGRQAVVSLGDGSLHPEMNGMITIDQGSDDKTWDQWKPKLMAGIREAKERWERGEVNSEASAYWNDHMDHDKFKQVIENL